MSNNPSSGPGVTESIPTANGIRLTLQGLGPIPSFKNTKRVVFQSDGTGKPVTEANTKAWMRRATKLIASQLCSAFQTEGGTTLAAAQARSLIASLPHDDCWTCIPELAIRSELCEPGKEGAEIIICEINNDQVKT